ncbi:MAG: iron ABC transporter permease [Bacteroidota bacterium]
MQRAISVKNIGKHSFSLMLMLFLLFFLLIASLAIGAVPISPLEVLQVFSKEIGISTGINTNETQQIVLLNIRLPRLLFTIFIGAALGISGATLQGLFRNPLVEPGIIGVSSGAALGAIVVIVFIARITPISVELFKAWLLPMSAFLGAVTATFITLKIGKYEGKTKVTYVILAGVAVSALANAAIGLSIFYADDQQLRTFTFWTLGDLSVATWDKIYILFPLICSSIIGLIGLARPLNALALGEAEAFHSGVSVEKVKLVAVLLSALVVGTSVAFAGVIGFIGLVVPHIIRISLSPDHLLVLPASAIGGACLLLLADIIARTVVTPAELPIGVVTAMIGTPFFIYLLIRSKQKRLI